MSYKNITWFTISNAPGTSGDFTVSTAVDSLHVTLGAADDGLSFSTRILETGVGSEVRTSCLYTHSTATLSRGTLESSTSGSALSFTSAAQVQVLGATAVSAASVELPLVAGPDANTNLVAGRTYVVDAASLTSTRTYTLPATAKAGERVQIMLSSESASYEVIITAATGDTLNGVAGGTEWSRLFIAGEVITLRCVTDSSAWVVERDGRMLQNASLELTTDASSEPAATLVLPTSYGGAWTNASSRGISVVTATGRLYARRNGTYNITFRGRSTSALTTGKYIQFEALKNGATSLFGPSQMAAGANVVGIWAPLPGVPLVVGDYVQLRWRSEEGAKGLRAAGQTAIYIVEVL